MALVLDIKSAFVDQSAGRKQSQLDVRKGFI